MVGAWKGSDGRGHGRNRFYAFAAVFGMAFVLDMVPGMSRGIEIAGGLALAWMGVGRCDMQAKET